MSIKIVIDASAWLDYFEDAPASRQVENYLQHEEPNTLTVTLAEIVSKISRSGKDPSEAIIAIKTLSRVVAVDEEIAISAGQIHAERRKKHPKFALSDAFIAAWAQKMSAKILTRDTDFLGLKETIFLK